MLIGSSHGAATLYAWNESSGLSELCHPREGFSIYSVSISPEGNHFAFATKEPRKSGGRGYLEVRSLGGDSSNLERAYALKFPAYSVDWLDGRTLVVGTVEETAHGVVGTAKLFKVEGSNELRPLSSSAMDISRHRGAVVHVRALGDSRLLTTCYNNVAYIWNIAEERCEYEFVRHWTGAHPLPMLPSSVPFPEERLLLIQFSNGYLYLMDQNDGWRDEPAPFIEGPCGGFCSLGDRIVVGAWGSSVAHVFEVGSWKPVCDYDFGRPFQKLLPLAPDRLAVHHTDLTVAIWQIGENAELLDSLKTGGVRSIGGGLPSERMLQAVRSRRADAEAEQINALKKSFDSARDFQDVRQHLTAILESGHGFKGLVLLADWCRRQNNPIAELHVRTEMCRDLPAVPESAVHLRLLGELLASLGEPVLAVDALRRAANCDPGQSGLDELIVDLEKVAPIVDDNDALHPVALPDGGIGAGCEKIAEFVLRDFAAGRSLPRRYALEVRSGVPLVTTSLESLSSETYAELLGTEMQNSLGVASLPVTAENGTSHEAEFIEYRPKLARGDRGEEVSLLCEPILRSGHLEYTLLVSVNPAQTPANEERNPAPFLAPLGTGQSSNWIRESRRSISAGSISSRRSRRQRRGW